MDLFSACADGCLAAEEERDGCCCLALPAEVPSEVRRRRTRETGRVLLPLLGASTEFCLEGPSANRKD